MRTRNKKTFELSSIKKYKQYERKLWLIPLATFLFSAISVSGKALHEFMEKPSIETLLGMLLFLLVSTLVLSTIPFFAGKILITKKRQIAIENCTITNMQDFDYYRIYSRDTISGGDKYSEESHAGDQANGIWQSNGRMCIWYEEFYP